MKRWLCILLSVICVLSLSACAWSSKRRHRTYKEVLAFAQSIDPNATVEEQYTDIEDEDGHRYREWNAVIHGMECYVASSERWEDVFAGEFFADYFVVDTDYDYYLLEKILQEKQSDWSLKEPTAFNRYQWNDIIGVETSYTERRELSSEELELAWQQAYEVYTEYHSHSVRKEAHFYVMAPRVFSKRDTREKYIRFIGCTMSDFDEQSKPTFLSYIKSCGTCWNQDCPSRNKKPSFYLS